MSNVEKGRRTEREILNYYLNSGYSIYWRAIRTKFALNSNDFFGLFDIVVREGKYTIYAQIKTNSPYSIYRIAREKCNQGISLRDFVEYYATEYEKVLYWNKKQKQKRYDCFELRCDRIIHLKFNYKFEKLEERVIKWEDILT